MAEIISSGTTEATSSDITVVDGALATVFLVAGSSETIPHSASASIQIKGAGGGYITIGRLDRSQPSQVISAPGVYRVKRHAGAACSVDQT